jgi:hypothetical protein
LLAAVISGIALGSWIAARWELAMLRIIQANHLALNLNVLAVRRSQRRAAKIL